MNEKAFTAKELAAMLRVHPMTVRRAAWRGELRTVRIGRRVRFAPDFDVQEFLSHHPRAAALAAQAAQAAQTGKKDN